MTVAGAYITSKTTPDAIVEQFNVSRESRLLLDLYADLLRKWQQRINLIAPSTEPQIWQRHIADGLQLVRFIPYKPVRIVDIGTGSGIPGIVLAIMLTSRPGSEVHLVESNGKKAAFLGEVIRKTGIPAKVHRCRFEDLVPESLGDPVDILTARAVAPLCELLSLCEEWLNNGAKALFCKGQDVGAELTEATKYWRIDCIQQPSLCDSRGCILDIREIERVTRV